jgi:serine phosphatase RsbU (regulator of sigma subunit)
MNDRPLDTGDAGSLLEHLTEELRNFEDIARYLVPEPGELPRLQGIDVWGSTFPLSGSVGGDHLIYVDFKQRFDLDARIRRARAKGKIDVAENLELCRQRAGIAVIDVAGHRVTDALLAAMLHQAFLVGALYELEMFGRITKRLFENLNMRFYQSSAARKFVSLLYGEISEDAQFRFLSAAQPFPAVFSRRHDRFMEVDPELRVSFPPLGMLPWVSAIDGGTTAGSPLGFKDSYETNEWRLMGAGDILLLHTDGLSEHRRGDEPYFPHHVEHLLRGVKDAGARTIVDALHADLVAFAPPTDDISLVVVKLAV